jgi:choline dehydrogenase-like flavoprotein
MNLIIACRAVNYMALARGPAADYDEWAKIVGDHGWKWEKILPLMRQVRIFERHCW